MAALVVVSLVGMVVDERLLLGESVWLKPAKFGLAFALYGVTLAWILRLPHRGRRATWWLGTVFAITGVVDVGSSRCRRHAGRSAISTTPLIR